MILSIVIFIVLFIRDCIVSIRESDIEYFFLVGILSNVFIGIGMLLITCLVSICISPDEIIYKETTTPIVALEDNTAINGMFFLGSGQVKNDIRYYYMIETEYGCKLQHVDADDAYIKYDTEPRVTIKTGYGFKHWYNNIWALPFRDYYTFYVPEGTILSNYNIDLQ